MERRYLLLSSGEAGRRKGAGFGPPLRQPLLSPERNGGTVIFPRGDITAGLQLALGLEKS